MKNFALDLWADLRAKRLWPVALLLVAALVAVPLVFLKSSEAPVAAQAPVDAPKGAGVPAVSLDPDGLAGSSDLDRFARRNPFRPQIIRERGRSGSGGSSAGDDPSAAGATGSASASTFGGGTTASPGFSGGDLVSPRTGVKPGSGGDPNPGSGGAPRITRYAWAVDVKVGRRGRETTRRGVDRLALLPSSRTPLLVFLGVNTAGDTAVFLVDSELSQSGEGSCKPNKNSCSFVYLKVDDDQDEHFFAAEDGTEYGLELLDIKRKVISASKARKSDRRPPARHARTNRWSFGFPLFLDAQRRR